MKNLITFLLLIFAFTSFGQIEKPVKWETSVKKISDTEVELIAKATIDGDWHLYSQNVPDGGPVATTFTFESNANYLKKGNTKEEEGTTVHDKVFQMDITYFGHEATFKQRIKLKSAKSFKVNAVVEYMACDDSRCLPPTEEDLVFKVN